ncbi:Hyphancin-3E [Eumeta japonica]|uniref:Hyphancin-3E n=1 Tax=Eumeta variegata TaxID=151549 RepID=A0A4C1TWL9_EUMVA|nr:Hyphancin-3E [Eumeta japonica]
MATHPLPPFIYLIYSLLYILFSAKMPQRTADSSEVASVYGRWRQSTFWSVFKSSTSNQSVIMKYFSVTFVLVLLVVVVANVSAAPTPGWGFLKDIERAVRRVRDSVISAGPAVAVLAGAKALG